MMKRFTCHSYCSPSQFLLQQLSPPIPYSFQAASVTSLRSQFLPGWTMTYLPASPVLEEGPDAGVASTCGSNYALTAWLTRETLGFQTCSPAVSMGLLMHMHRFCTPNLPGFHHGAACPGEPDGLLMPLEYETTIEAG